MDLSQQELPLTAYFSRGSKEARSRVVRYKPTEDSQPATRSSKRRKSDVPCSTSPPAGQSKSRLTTLQLPTPVASTRKCVRTGRLELPGKPQLTSTGASRLSIEQSASLPSEKDVTRLEFEHTPLKLSRKGVEDARPEFSSTPLTTSPTCRRKRNKLIGVECHPDSLLSSHAGTGIATPRTLPRKISDPARGIDTHSALAGSNFHLPLESSGKLSCPPVEQDCSDPFYAGEKFSGRDGVFALPKLCPVRPETSNSQPSDVHAIPMIPVPSSQSQYLLHLDATPKRKRCLQRIDHVVSSQTQEERELTLSTPHKPVAVVSSSRVCSGKHILGNSRQNGQHYIVASTSVASYIKSPAGPSRCFVTNRTLDEHLSEPSSPSRHVRSTSHPSPGCKTKTPKGYCDPNLIESIPPAPAEDSVTESEPDSDVVQPRMKGQSSTLELPPREMNEFPGQPSVVCDPCPPIHCGFAGVDLVDAEDDSATEAESDTEILHCVAEIGKKRPRDHRSNVSRADIPPLPVISPLVSPARPRIATMPLMIGPTQLSQQECVELSVPGSCGTYPSDVERPQVPLESLPSVVRDFLRMFPGDESYPADFPESLRI